MAHRPGHPPIVTLLTDFGTSDYFVGALKGAILSVAPNATIVDITHQIPAHDISLGAFTLLAACPSFAPGTIHVAVVDPGVGSSRKPLLIAGDDQYFIGPDNGLFSYVLELQTAPLIFHLDCQEFFRDPISPTFHGRDVFGPVAGALASGVAPSSLGTLLRDPLRDIVRLPQLGPNHIDGTTIEASIINVDRFGNCVTNIQPKDLTDDMIKSGAFLLVNGRPISSFRKSFSQVEDSSGDLFAIWGSSGFLEIAINLGSAAQTLGVNRGDSFIIKTRG